MELLHGLPGLAPPATHLGPVATMPGLSKGDNVDDGVGPSARLLPCGTCCWGSLPRTSRPSWTPNSSDGQMGKKAMVDHLYIGSSYPIKSAKFLLYIFFPSC